MHPRYTKCTAMHQSGPINVRFGSKADIGARPRNVCFTPKSGHRNSVVGCPLCARSGHQSFFKAPWHVGLSKSHIGFYPFPVNIADENT